jgi:hypothetical protein
VPRDVERGLAGEPQRIPVALLPRDEVGSKSAAAFWLAMKLSFTKYTFVAPAAVSSSGSASTWAGVFSLGLRP